MRHHLRSIGDGCGPRTWRRTIDGASSRFAREDANDTLRAGTSTSRRPRLLFRALEETISSSVDEGNEEAKGG